MRAVLAGLFTFGGLLLCVSLVFHYFPDGFGPPWLMGMSFALVLFLFAGASLFLFNKQGHRPSLSGKSFEEQIADLESQGLLVSETFQATRAFQVEEFEDEGSHYFIELADGTVLYLNGQYLYDYEQITDEPALNRSRRFPCSRFTVRRHKTAGYVVEIACAGDVLQPECEAPPFDKNDAKRGLIPEDGQIIRDRSYEQVKRERLKGRSEPARCIEPAHRALAATQPSRGPSR
jgi:hypothetical protein